MAPTRCSSTFLWRYGRMRRPGSGEFETVKAWGTGFADWYVRIVRLPEDPSEDASGTVLWVGRVSNDETTSGGVSVLATGTGEQTLTAYGLEYALEQSFVDGAYVLLDEEVVKVDTPLAFNLRHRDGVSLLGNRSSEKHGGCYVFSAEGGLWTAADVIEYLLCKFGPSVPAFTLAVGSAADNLGLHTDVWPAPRSVKDGLMKVIRRDRGHAWSVVCDGDSVQVAARSIFEETVAAGGVSIRPNVVVWDLDLDATGQLLQEPSIRRSVDHRFDEIRVLGAPLWVCGEVALTPAWSAEEETAYKAADDEARRHDAYRHVYAAFRSPSADSKPFLDAAGDPLGCPTVDHEGYPDFDQVAPLFALGKSLTRQTPLRDGYSYETGVEVKRVATSDAPAAFLPPAVYVKFTHAGEEVYAPVYRMAQALQLRGAPSVGVTPLDGEMGLRLNANPNHLFALNHWGESKSAYNPVFDYNNLHATAALRADVRLQVVVRLPRTLRSDCLRRLVIEVPDAECWIVRKGTIVGASGDSLTRVPKDIVLRNDHSRLAIVAAMARSWFGRTRRAISVAYDRIEYGSFVAGDLIRTVLAGSRTIRVGSMVTRVTWDWAKKATRLATDFGELDPVGASGQARRGGGRTASPSASAPGREANLPVRWPLDHGTPSWRVGVVLNGQELEPQQPTTYPESEGSPTGWWFDEVDPITLETFPGSTTRDADDSYTLTAAVPYAEGTNSVWHAMVPGSYFRFTTIDDSHKCLRPACLPAAGVEGDLLAMGEHAADWETPFTPGP